MPKPKNIALLLYPGFSALCLANTVEPLRAANSMAGAELYQWTFLSGLGGVVQSSSGMQVQTTRLATQRGDYLFVMPSYGHLDHDTVQGKRLLRQAAKRFNCLIGLDTGSWLLAAAGLLDGHRATSHWDILTSLAETFPEVDVVEDRYVIDGARGSCGGATTTFDLMLHLIEQHNNATLMLDVAALFMHGERTPDMPPDQRLPRNQTVTAAAALMRRHVEEPLAIKELARRLGVSQRALEITFKTHVGQSPSALYRRIRLGEARRRLDQSRESIAEIANRCGYIDASAMTRAFRKTFGVTPSDIRQR